VIDSKAKKSRSKKGKGKVNSRTKAKKGVSAVMIHEGDDDSEERLMRDERGCWRD
jgi:hypothetical protein